MKSKLFIITLLVLGLVSVSGLESRELYAEECEDIKGEEKWDGEGHGDNKPSEREFNEMIFEENATPCDVAEAIDKMEIAGEIKQHEMDEFRETFTYQAISQEVQDCYEDRFDLPGDNGKKRLAGYEIKDCATGNY